MQRIFIPWALFFLAGLWPAGFAYAQSCDCADAGNCPFSIEPDSSYQLCYDITDAFNDDLSDPAQGVCGVRLTFTHQHIWDLEISLVSPAGDTVPLIGPSLPYFGTTNSVLWDVLFLPCAYPVAPDTVNGTPLAATWTNNQDWPFAGIIGGSYHPVGNNCLEDFNNGPVNGSWCLLIDNDPSFYPGQILNFEILLCDNSGLLCCEADAGSLAPYPDLYVCQGDSSLLLDIPPVYFGQEPDTLEYGYQYLISDTSGIIVELDSIADLTTYDPGAYNVCVLAYRLSEEDSLYVVTPGLPVDTLLAILNGPAPPFCGDISSSCVRVVIEAPPPLTVLNESLCQGDSLQVGDSLFYEAGTYNLLLSTAAGCDSLVELHLSVFPHDTTALSFTLCPGDSLFIADTVFGEPDNYEVLLQNQYGCDSLLRIQLTHYALDTTFLSDTICQGETYAIGDSVFTLSGNYTLHFPSVLTGCDSTVMLSLTVLDLQAQILQPDTLTCAVEEVLLDGAGSSIGTGIAYNWSTSDGLLTGPADSVSTYAGAAGTYVLEVAQYSCLVYDTVQVYAQQDIPIADAGPPDTLTCSTSVLTLDGTASATGPDLVYSWLSPNGNILSGADGLQPLVDAPGLYILSLTDTLTQCVGMDSVNIEIDTLAPLADAGPDGLLNCLTDSVVLDGSASYLPQGYEYHWTDENAVEVSWSGPLQAVVDVPGTYYLQVIDLHNGCEAVDSAVVTENMQLPAVDAGLPDTLTCSQSVVSLEGQGSSANALDFLWSTQAGNILGDSTIANVTVDAPGWYYLTVTDVLTHCSATDSVEVFMDTLSPMAEAGLPITLNCALTEWELGEQSGSSQGTEFSYTWLDEQGNVIGNALHLIVDTAGAYVLLVENTLTGCIASDTAFVSINQLMPLADAGPSDSLTCVHPQAILDGSASTQNPFMEYEWYNSNWQPVGSGLQIGVGQADTYCLVATNGLNFCADTACVSIAADVALPIAAAGADQALDCINGTAVLDAGTSSSGPPFEVFWTGSPGSFLTDSTQLQVQVQEAGWYVLHITNTNTACESFDSVQVYVDSVLCAPEVFAGADGLINCYSNLYDTLDATATPLAPYLQFQWIALSGNIVFGDETLEPVVTAGTYVLQVENTVVGVSAFDTVQVLTDLTTPVADAGPDTTLTCAELMQPLTLNGLGSSQGPNYIYEWSTLDGNILSGADGLTPTVDGFGIYDLLVTDTTNGCSATDAMLLELQGTAPYPCLPDILQIDCHDTTIVLGDTCIGHENYLYSWSVSNGQILGAADSALITAYVPLDAGIYYLEVVDTTNACTASDSVIVLAPDPCPPDCFASALGIFTCATDSIELSGLGSSVGPEFAYSWQALSGALCGPSTSLTACASAPGTYQLTVTDLGTGLSCSSSVEVFADTVPPLITLDEQAFINCSGQPAVLQASVSGDSLLYGWSAGPGACILGDSSQLSIEGACEGLYYFTAINQQNSCAAADSISVAYDTLSPLVMLNQPSILTCTDSSSLLTGAGSDFGPDFSWRWYQDGLHLSWADGVSGLYATEPGVYCLEITNLSNACVDSVCVEVLSQIDTPIVSFTTDAVLNCVDTLLVLEPAQAQQADWQYEWFTTDGCFLSSPLAYSVQTNCSGTYYLQVQDTQNGCSGYAVVEVIDQSAGLHAEAGPPDTLTCNQAQLVLDGTASDTGLNLVYSWLSPNGNILSGANGLQPLVDAPGLYYLELQDTLSGCVAIDSVEVSLDTLPPGLSAGPDQFLTCGQTQVQLEGDLTQPDISAFTWYGAGGQPIASDSLQPWVSEAGWYVLVVQNEQNGCAAYDSVQVVWDTLPPLAQIEAASSLLTCETSEVVLDGSQSQGSADLQFSWSTQDGHFVYGEQQAIAAVDSAGWYVLEVLDEQNACTDTAMIYVGADFAAPQVVIAPPDEITCAQPEVLLDGSASSSGNDFLYSWSSIPPGLPIDHADMPEATAYQAGIYVLEVQNTGNGCSDTAQVQLTENLVMPQAEAVALSEIDCLHSTVEVSGEPGSSQGPQYAYFWQPLSGNAGSVVFGESQITAEVEGSGFYVLEVTDTGNGCMAADTVEVTASQEPIASASIALTPPLCPGFDDGVLSVTSIQGGTEPYLYSLNGEPLGPYPTYHKLEAGTYSILIEDLNGCTWDTLIVLEDPPAIGVELSGDTLVELGAWADVTAQLFGESHIDSLWWTPVPPVLCDGCTSFSYQPLHNESWMITVADSNGCTASDLMLIHLRGVGQVYIPNAFSPNGDGINDVFFIQAGAGVLEVELFQVYDRWGEMLFEARSFQPNDPLYGWDGQLGGRSMNPGVFGWQARIRLFDGRVQWLEGEVLLVR